LKLLKVFNKRVEEASKYYKEILQKPFDYAVDEFIITDGKKLKFSTTEVATEGSMA
jgi:hypothetical protein